MWNGVKYVWNVAWRKEYSYKLEGETWSYKVLYGKFVAWVFFSSNHIFYQCTVRISYARVKTSSLFDWRFIGNYALAWSKFWSNAIQVSADQRQRLMMSTERLNRSSDRIRDSRKTMLETEDLGVSILQDLHQQRQSLLHAHDTVHNLFIFIHHIWTA